MNPTYISMVIPVHNEQENLETLHQRLSVVLKTTGKAYEIILVNDGSQDRSEQILDALFKKDSEHLRIVHFNGNYGQHMAIMAGLEHVRGEVIFTMDADLQNLPEDIPKLLAKIEEGHDVVGGCRTGRQDRLWRIWISKLHNKIRACITPRIIMKDEGCMLRAYKRHIVDLMIASGETSTFIPALALMYAGNPTEVDVSHAPRTAGETSYNLYKLIRYNFDLVTGFSLVPLQLFTMIGIVISLFSGLLAAYMLIRRVIVGPEAEGMFTLFTIMYFLVGLCLMGLGILGEYIGRIYQEVLKRPRFVVRDIVQTPTKKETITSKQ